MVKPNGITPSQQQAAVQHKVEQAMAHLTGAIAKAHTKQPAPPPKQAAQKVIASGPDGRPGAKARLKALSQALAKGDSNYAREVLAEIRKQDPDADTTWLRQDITEQMALAGDLNGGERYSIEQALNGSSAPVAKNVVPTDLPASPAGGQQLTDAEVEKLKNGTEQEQLQTLAAIAKRLGDGQQQIPLATLQKMLKDKGITNPKLEALVKGQGTVTALVKMIDTLNKPDASVGEKVAAVLGFVEKAGGNFTGGAQTLLKPYLTGVKSANAIVGAINTFADPKATPVAKAKAAFEIASALKDAGELNQTLAKRLGGLTPAMNLVSDAFTIISPDSTAQDRAKAVIDMAANIPFLVSDWKAFKAELQERGMTPAEIDAARNLVGEGGDAVAKAVTPEALRGLSSAEIDKLKTVLADPELKASAEKALSKLKDPEAVKAMLNSLDRIGGAAEKKAFLGAVGGTAEGVADKLLTSTIDGKNGARVLAELSGKLDAGGREALTKLLGSMDQNAFTTFLRVLDKLPVDVLNKALPALAKADGKVVANFFKLADKFLSKMGVELTEKVAGKILGTAVKCIPVVGAIPNAQEIYDLGKIAADPKTPPEIAYLARFGMKVNATDAVLALVEPFIDEFGVPVAASVGMAGVELFVGLAVEAESAKAAQQGDKYVAPDWLKAADVVAAAASGPQGIVELAATLGPKKFEDAVMTAGRMGGQALIAADKAIAIGMIKGMRFGAHMQAVGLHTLADMIRNPDKYKDLPAEIRKAAADKICELANGVGDLAIAAGDELKSLAGDLKNLGTRGIEALDWIAQHPGKAAEIAKNALADMVKEGKEAATQAWDKLVSYGKEAGPFLEKAVQGLVDGGKRSVEVLKHIIENPGEAGDSIRKMAMESLGAIAKGVGDGAKQALDTLVYMYKNGIPDAWNIIKTLASEGGSAAIAVGEALKDAGISGAKEIWGGITDLGSAIFGH